MLYSVTEKKKKLGDQYEPTVLVSTKKSRQLKLKLVFGTMTQVSHKKVVDKNFSPLFKV